MNLAKRSNPLVLAWPALLAVVGAIGLVGAVRIFMRGHELFNANDVLLWTLPLGAYIYLALASSGLTLLAGLPLMFGIEKFETQAKRLVFLATATLMGAFVAIGLELGNVFHMFYLFLSPNFGSPIWWMGFIYSIELVILILKFQRMHVGDFHSGLSRALGTLSFFAALAAPLMIGSVFGLTESRATYFGPVMSIYCLLMALLSGSALILFYLLVLSRFPDPGETSAQRTIRDGFTRIFAGALSAVIVFTLVKIAIESSTVIPDFLNYRQYAQIFGGIGRFNTEILLGLFLPFLMMIVPALRQSTASRMAASLLVLAGTLAMHMEILLAGQSRPIGPKAEQFPETVSYLPSAGEWQVFMLAAAVVLLLYWLGERFLKLDSRGKQHILEAA